MLRVMDITLQLMFAPITRQTVSYIVCGESSENWTISYGNKETIFRNIRVLIFYSHIVMDHLSKLYAYLLHIYI